MDLESTEQEQEQEPVFDIEAEEPDKETVENFFDKLTGAYDKVAPTIEKVKPTRGRGRPRKDGSTATSTTTRKKKDENPELDNKDIAEMAAGAVLLILGFFVQDEYKELLPTSLELTAILLPWERIRARHHGSIASKVSADGQDVLFSVGAIFTYFDRLRELGHERQQRQPKQTSKSANQSPVGLRGQQLENLSQGPFTDLTNLMPTNTPQSNQQFAGVRFATNGNKTHDTNNQAHAQLFNDATNQLLLLDLQGRNQQGING